MREVAARLALIQHDTELGSLGLYDVSPASAV